MRQCLLERLAELSRVAHAPALHAIGLGNSGVVGGAEIDREVTLVEAGLLTGLDPAVDAVRDHHEGDRELQARNGFELAHGEPEAAVAHDRNALDAWAAKVRADRGGHRIAKRAVCAVGEQAPPCASNREVRGQVRARRSGIRDNDCIVVQRLGKLGHHSLRLDGLVVGRGELVELGKLLAPRLVDRLRI